MMRAVDFMHLLAMGVAEISKSALKQMRLHSDDIFYGCNAFIHINIVNYDQSKHHQQNGAICSTVCILMRHFRPSPAFSLCHDGAQRCRLANLIDSQTDQSTSSTVARALVCETIYPIPCSYRLHKAGLTGSINIEESTSERTSFKRGKGTAGLILSDSLTNTFKNEGNRASSGRPVW